MLAEQDRQRVEMAGQPELLAHFPNGARAQVAVVGLEMAAGLHPESQPPVVHERSASAGGVEDSGTRGDMAGCALAARRERLGREDGQELGSKGPLLGVWQRHRLQDAGGGEALALSPAQCEEPVSSAGGSGSEESSSADRSKASMASSVDRAA